jgi:hypothetical protein
VSARVITSKGRKHVKTRLERAMLLSFRKNYGRVTSPARERAGLRPKA